MDEDRVQYKEPEDEKQDQMEVQDQSDLRIVKSQDAKLKIDYQEPTENPLIYTGNSPSYMDPRSNSNYYAEDTYADFEQYAKNKKATPLWEGDAYDPFEGTSTKFKYETYQLPSQEKPAPQPRPQPRPQQYVTVSPQYMPQPRPVASNQFQKKPVSMPTTGPQPQWKPYNPQWQPVNQPQNRAPQDGTQQKPKQTSNEHLHASADPITSK